MEEVKYFGNYNYILKNEKIIMKLFINRIFIRYSMNRY